MDSRRQLYALQWLHNGRSPNLHLAVVREPGEWFDSVATSLLGALNRHDLGLLDALLAHRHRRTCVRVWLCARSD
jgi:hypothetical protein